MNEGRKFRGTALASAVIGVVVVSPVATGADLEKLRAVDSTVSQGVVVYDVRPSFAAQNAGGPRSLPYRLSLSYAGDGRFRRTRQNLGPEASPPLVELHDGRQSMFVHPGSVIVGGGPSVNNPVAELMMLTPGACAVMGRGLSRLSGLTIAMDGSTPIVEGVARDGTRIRASMDPGRDWIATRIERRSKDKQLIAVWTLASPVKSKDGVWLPSEATYEAFRTDGRPVATERYRLVSAEFREPSAATFTVGLEKRKVIDQRFGAPVGLPATATEVRTLGEALSQTEQVAGQLARMEAERRRRASHENAVRLALSGLLAASVAGFGWALFRAWRRT